MTWHRFDRAAVVLGGAALVSTVFALTAGLPYPFRLIRVDGPGVAVLAGVGVCGVVGGLLARRELVVIAGAGAAVAAVLQLVQAGRDTNWLAGNMSTVSLLAGLAIGLLAVGLAPRGTPPRRRNGSTPAP